MAKIMYNNVPYGGGFGGIQIIDKTYEEYQALSEAEKMRDDVIYNITDKDNGVTFGNSDISNVGDGTVTGAITEVNSNRILVAEGTTPASGNGEIGVTLPSNAHILSIEVLAYDQWRSGSTIGINVIDPTGLVYMVNVQSDYCGKQCRVNYVVI